MLKVYLKIVGDPKRATVEQIKDYILSLNSNSSQRQCKGALQHFYQHVLGQPQKVKRVPYAPKRQALPKVLSIKQVRQVVICTRNLKHKTLLSLSYCAALRVSELCSIQLQDINWHDKQLRINQGKGRKDRIIPINDKMLQLLSHYIDQYQPNSYLFAGQFGGAYSAASAQKVLKYAAKAAGLHMQPTIHTLRHSRATHLLDGGLDIHFVSQLLGHAKLETTQIYLHMSKRSMAAHMALAEKNLAA